MYQTLQKVAQYISGQASYINSPLGWASYHLLPYLRNTHSSFFLLQFPTIHIPNGALLDHAAFVIEKIWRLSKKILNPPL